MPINPLDVIGNQVKSAARNQVRTAQAEFRRETSIVGYANARIGAAAKKLGSMCRSTRPSWPRTAMCAVPRSSPSAWRRIIINAWPAGSSAG